MSAEKAVVAGSHGGGSGPDGHTAWVLGVGDAICMVLADLTGAAVFQQPPVLLQGVAGRQLLTDMPGWGDGHVQMEKEAAERRERWLQILQADCALSRCSTPLRYQISHHFAAQFANCPCQPTVIDET